MRQKAHLGCSRITIRQGIPRTSITTSCGVTSMATHSPGSHPAPPGASSAPPSICGCSQVPGSADQPWLWLRRHLWGHWTPAGCKHLTISISSSHSPAQPSQWADNTEQDSRLPAPRQAKICRVGDSPVQLSVLQSSAQTVVPAPRMSAILGWASTDRTSPSEAGPMRTPPSATAHKQKPLVVLQAEQPAQLPPGPASCHISTFPKTFCWLTWS